MGAMIVESTLLKIYKVLTAGLGDPYATELWHLVTWTLVENLHNGQGLFVWCMKHSLW